MREDIVDLGERIEHRYSSKNLRPEKKDPYLECLLAFQEILQSQIETLISTFKCDSSLYGCAQEIWKKYLEFHMQLRMQKKIIRTKKEQQFSHLNVKLSLAICYLVCLRLNEPILCSDIMTWVLNGSLPFTSTISDLNLSKEVGNFLSSKLGFVPTRTEILDLTLDTANCLKIKIPPSNYALILHKLLHQMDAPQLLPIALKLHSQLFKTYFDNPDDLANNEVNLVVLAAVTILISFHPELIGQDYSLFTTLPDIKAWIQQRFESEAIQDERHASWVLKEAKLLQQRPTQHIFEQLFGIAARKVKKMRLSAKTTERVALDDSLSPYNTLWFHLVSFYPQYLDIQPHKFRSRVQEFIDHLGIGMRDKERKEGQGEKEEEKEEIEKEEEEKNSGEREQTNEVEVSNSKKRKSREGNEHTSKAKEKKGWGWTQEKKERLLELAQQYDNKFKVIFEKFHHEFPFVKSDLTLRSRWWYWTNINK